MLQLDSVARRYGVLPHQLLGIRNRLKGLSVDLWAHNYAIQEEGRQLYLARIKAKRGGR